MPAKIRIRKGTIKDLNALVELEERGFAGDKFSARRYKYLLTEANATVLIIESDRKVAGGAIVLWRTRLQIARLYNIVIDPAFQGLGLGARLLAECEQNALKKDCKRLSLEVRIDNKNAIEFYKRHGYRVTEKLAEYYTDKSAGYRMVKHLGLPPLEKARF